MEYDDTAYKGFTYQFDIEPGEEFGTFFVLRDDQPVLTVPGVLHMGGYFLADAVQTYDRNIRQVGRYFADQIRKGQ